MSTQNKEDPMNNNKVVNAKWGAEKLRMQKSHSVKIIMRLVWKIHEVARGEGPLTWDWGVPHVKIYINSFKGLWNW